MIGCYYCLYHSALALLIKKGLFSKNHEATLCILIKEYHFPKEDIILLDSLNNQDILFYAETKYKRKKASYSTNLLFQDLDIIILKTRFLFNKIKEILNQ